MKQSQAYKGYASTYSVEISNFLNPELQLKNTESAIKNKLMYLLSRLRRFKFVTTLVLEFQKMKNDDKIIYNNFDSNSKAETIFTENDIVDVFESIYITVISNIQKSLGQHSGWIIISVIDHNINISKYNT